MAIPEQIRKQSEEIHKFYNPENPDETEGQDADPDGQDDNEDVDQVSSRGEDEDATPAPARDHGSDGDEETFAHKYKTLQGMYNSDVARLQAANKQYEDRVSHLEQLIASVKTPQKDDAGRPKTQAEPQRYVSETDIEEYGDSIDVMRKVSKEELNPIMSKMSQLESTLSELANNLNGSVMPTVQNVAKQQQQSASDRFWSDLSRRVPNWQQLNNDDGFKDWLLEVDPLSGETRQKHLAAAQENLNVDRVVAFFEAYAPQSGEKAKTDGQPSRSASELEKQIAPGRSRSAGKPVDQSSKTYSPEQIRDFYSKVRAGKFRGREKERDRIERDIFAAQQDGRIVQNA